MSAADALSRRALRALIVEAELDDCELLLQELGRAHFEVSHRRVDSPAALAEALAEEAWDVVLSDFALPALGALEALEIVRRSARAVPLIVVSGTHGEEAAVAALHAGAHDFLIKGRLTRLAAAVERALGEVELRREREAAQEALQEQLMVSDRMASVGILAAGVAHEINNPLSAAMANLDLAIDDIEALVSRHGAWPEFSEILEQLADAREASARVRDIVLDLKVFSRLQDDKREPVDVEHVLESAVRMAQNEIRHRARLVKNYGALPPVQASESRLGQVFLNLIVNAAHAIPEGQAGANEIGLTTRVDADGTVVVEVRDTGSGMSASVKKRLFTPFFTTKPIGVGTGLGLSLCHRIVTGLGGEISVESEVGKGSVFRVHLPPAPLGSGRSARELAPGPSPVRRAAVLVVDDEEIVGKAIRRTLARDHDVSSTSSAAEALRMIASGTHFDIILCDLMMPHMTGMELHAELERIAPAAARRMVFLTGGAFTASAREFLERVENDWLEKPFDVAALRALVRDSIT